MKKIFLYLASTLALVGSLLGIAHIQETSQAPIQGSEQNIGVSFPDAKWVNIDKFEGFQTKADSEKVSDGANPNGQNTVVNDGDRVSIRDFGFTVTGNSSTASNYIHSLHTFRRRSGENIVIRGDSTVLEYLEAGNSTWENLGSGYSTNTPFDFVDYNINTDQRSYVYFGNGTDSFSRWTGSHTLTNGAVLAAAIAITVDDTTDFTATGTIHFCSSDVPYTGKTATTFTGLSGVPACADNRGVTQAVEVVANAPKGNILLNANNRIFIAGITTTPQAVYFSGYGEPTNFVGASLITTSTADSPGIFNLAEGGGAVTAMVLDEGSIYMFKNSIIYKATLSDSLYTIEPLKPFDGKSQSTGANNSGSVFTGGNGVFFITPDKQIMNLSRIATVDYPQISPISESIKPTISSAIFTSSTGIFWENTGYFAARSDSSVASNNSVFLYNNNLQAWESPIVGWSPSLFTIYNDGTGDALYFGDANSTNVYKVTEGALDNSLGVTANWRSKQFNFGFPSTQKEIDNVYIEGYISDNTHLNISLLLDENGASQTYTTEFRGTETAFVLNGDPFNLFGFNPFGFERFGSSDQSDKKKFRIYLNKSFRPVPFYNAQIEFASDGENQSWEITDFGFLVREHSEPERPSLYRVFN